MKVKVEQRHIDAGKVECSHCPIALAIAEKQKKRVSVMYTNAYIYNEKYGFRYKLPEIAQNFIALFDRKIPMNPIEFEMECVEKFERI